jgi:hypothetical protein
MEHVPYVGFATYRRVTVRTRFTFCIYIKKKGRHSTCLMGHVFAEPVFWVCNYNNMFYKL